MSNGPSPNSPPASESKSRLSKKLPTFRAGFTKQLDALRAYAVLSDNGTKVVHYTKVAEIIKVHEANMSSMNPFFLEVGFLEKRDAGYVPTLPVLEYNRQYSWNQDTAAQKLSPIIVKSWFGQALVHRLQFRSMSEDDAIETLAGECMAGPQARPQLRMLLDYCEAGDILERANGQVTQRPFPRDTPQPSVTLPPITEEVRNEKPHPAADAPARAKPFAGVAPTPNQDGSINLNIGLQVSLAEMKDWPADRIAAFFAGIAQVLAAKNAEK